MLTVRLTSSEEKSLNEYCEIKGLSKSEVVKEAIELYLVQHRKNSKPYDVGEDLFGLEGSGTKDKSTTYKKRIKDLLNEKHSH
jgi:predicted DNA-binding protein